MISGTRVNCEGDLDRLLKKKEEEILCTTVVR